MVPFTDSHQQLQSDAGGRSAAVRHPHAERTVHAEGSVLHDAALRPSRSRSGRVPPESRRARQHAVDAVARRDQEDGQRRAHQRLRVLGQPPSGAGADRQRPVDRRAAEDGARQGRPQGQRARDRVLRRRPRQGSGELPRHQLRRRAAVRPQHSSRARDGQRSGAVPRLRVERRAADQAPGRAAALDHAGLVRRPEREVALGYLRPGRSVSRQVPGELVPHPARRDDQRRGEVGRAGGQPPAAQVVRRARDQERRRSQDHDHRAERRHADQDRRSEGG